MPQNPAGSFLAEAGAYPFDVGSVFVLAAGGLRRLRGDGESFLGHTAANLFWKDVLDLVHADDLGRADKLVFDAAARPESVFEVVVRIRDAWGFWTPVKATVRNIAEAPDDGGLVLAEFRDVGGTNGHGTTPHP